MDTLSEAFDEAFGNISWDDQLDWYERETLRAVDTALKTPSRTNVLNAALLTGTISLSDYLGQRFG